MDCPMDASNHSFFWLELVCTSEKVSHRPHWKDSACGHHGNKQETVRKFLCSWARSPWQFSLSSCVATPFFIRQTSSWTTAKSGQKELRNSSSSVYFSLLVLGLLPPRYVKSASGLNNLNSVIMSAYICPNHHCPKPQNTRSLICLTFTQQL